MIDSLASSLSVLSFLFFLEKNNAPDAQILYTTSFVDSLNSAYFEPMVHTMSAGMSSLNDSLKTQHVSTHDPINVKKSALDQLQMQLA